MGENIKKSILEEIGVDEGGITHNWVRQIVWEVLNNSPDKNENERFNFFV